MILQIGLALTKAPVANITGNIKKIGVFCARASKLNVELLLFSKMVSCSYSLEELLVKKHFSSENRVAIGAPVKDCPKRDCHSPAIVFANVPLLLVAQAYHQTRLVWRIPAQFLPE